MNPFHCSLLFPQCIAVSMFATSSALHCQRSHIPHAALQVRCAAKGNADQQAQHVAWSVKAPAHLQLVGRHAFHVLLQAGSALGAAHWRDDSSACIQQHLSSTMRQAIVSRLKRLLVCSMSSQGPDSAPWPDVRTLDQHIARRVSPVRSISSPIQTSSLRRTHPDDARADNATAAGDACNLTLKSHVAIWRKSRATFTAGVSGRSGACRSGL